MANVSITLCMGYFNWFHQFRCHRYLNEKPFSQLALFFLQFWVFEAIFEARGKNFSISKNSVCTSYCTLSDGFNAKIGLQTCFLTWHAKPDRNPFCFFSNISVQGFPFSNRFLHWNRGIKRVVLSTIKGTNGDFKNQKILPASLRNGLKIPKL